MIKFIKGIFILIDGMMTVFKHLFMKAVTVQYPEKRRELNDEFRGRLEVHRCIGCGICKKVCPSGAVNFEKDEQGKVISYTFDLTKPSLSTYSLCRTLPHPIHFLVIILPSD